MLPSATKENKILSGWCKKPPACHLAAKAAKVFLHNLKKYSLAAWPAAYL
jgi:hypothetical protein